MKTLLIVTALIEIGAGLALLVAPSVSVSPLLGASLDSVVGEVIGRIAGAALFSLGAACWLARHDQGRAAVGLVTAMLFYNTAVVGILAYATLGSGLSSIWIWLAVFIHMAMGVWCLACLRIKWPPH